MNIVGWLALATCQLDIPTAVHAKQVAHTRHDRRIAFLFKLSSLEAKLQRMLVLEWHSALG